MSLTRTRVNLTHRLTIQRDASIGTDNGWGNPDVPDWQTHLADVPCRAWTDVGHGPRVGNETVRDLDIIVVNGIRAIVPLGTDVTESDRIDDITNRGTVIFAGPMNVQAVMLYPDHLELALQKVK